MDDAASILDDAALARIVARVHWTQQDVDADAARTQRWLQQVARRATQWRPEGDAQGRRS